MKTYTPQLLSPAGDFDCLKAAVANGADAVYFGLSTFNARQRAHNFTLEELPEVMKYLHAHNVQGFLTLNTLIFSDELAECQSIAIACASARVDAIIVQDLGLALLLHTLSPDLVLHGSTQMTLTEPLGINFAQSLGVQRVILARELSIAEIGKITDATDLPVEAFLHGALCVAYSGQCLTSESLGGRSANRGQCAQACRLPYDLVVDGAFKNLDDKAYLLSPKDLAAWDLLPQLLAAKVFCFKIEGRLKSAHYVAAATRVYRLALDQALANQKINIPKELLTDLNQSFSRGFAHGFLDGANHKQLVHARFPKSRGIKLGVVIGTTHAGLRVQLEPAAQVKPGDGIVLDEGHPEQDEQGGRIYEVLPQGKSTVELRLALGDLQLSAISKGALVWKTDDPASRKRLEQTFSREQVVRPEKISATLRAVLGQPLELTFTDAQNRSATAKADHPAVKAEKHPLSHDHAFKQLARLGDTPFELDKLTLLGATEASQPDPVLAPQSVLNNLRREAAQKLLSQRQSPIPLANPDALNTLRNTSSPCKQGEDTGGGDPLPTQQIPHLNLLVRTLDQLRASCSLEEKPSLLYADFEDVKKYKEALEIARQANIPLALATLRVIKPHEHGLLKSIADLSPDGVLIRNLAALSYFKTNHPNLPLYGDYSLNVANDLTAQLFHSAGLKTVAPSYDLNFHQMIQMFSRFNPAFFEVVAHQNMPMFHMEHCVFCAVLSTGKDFRDCGRPCDKHSVQLQDRMGKPHPLIADIGCRNTVYNADAQSALAYLPQLLTAGIKHFRVELLTQKPHEIAPLLTPYTTALKTGAVPPDSLRNLRVLSQLGVVPGTLDRE